MATKGIIDGLLRIILYASFFLAGITVLWRFLLIPGEVVQHPTEVRYLASPLEIMVVAYVALWALKRHKLGIGEERFGVAAIALKAATVFYCVGLMAIFVGYVGLCSPAGLVAAALYSLKGNVVTRKNLIPPYMPRLSSEAIIPVPSLNGPGEIPLGLCTPPDRYARMAFNVHLGREARSYIALSMKRSVLRAKGTQSHVERVATIFGSRPLPRGSAIAPRDIQNHLSRKINRGYLIDPSRGIAEVLKALNAVSRRGVEVNLQFLWTREKEGISARHLLVASSNDLRAFSKFEADLIRGLPSLGFLEAPLAAGLMADLRSEGFLKPVGESYLKEILPMGISYEPSALLDRVAPRGYVEGHGKKWGALSFPFPQGHMLLVGDKSSGKTRFAHSLVSALEEMNAVVIIIDPHEEYSPRERQKEGPYLNPFRPPLDVDVLTHSGNLLVLSPSLASAFSVEEPQDEMVRFIEMDEPLLKNYLAEMAGKADGGTCRIRAAISELAEETGIDEAIRGIPLPSPMQNVIVVEIPQRHRDAAALLTELFLAWGASLAISKQTEMVIMLIEDADELLNVTKAPNVLEYAEDYGLSLILISRSCAPFIPFGQHFSLIAGFRMSGKESAESFRTLVGLGGDEPEGLQIEAMISDLHRGESLLFLRDNFEFLMAKASESGEGDA